MAHFPFIVKFFITLSILLFICFIAFSISLLYIRLKKNNEKRLHEKLKDIFEKKVFALVLEEDFYDQLENIDFKSKVIASFKAVYKENHVYKDVLIRELMALTLSLSGDYKKRVVDLYLILSLDEHSIRKIEHPFWEVKIQGIKEVSIFHVEHAVNKIAVYINDHNQILRKEARIAFIELNARSLGVFITNVNTPITYWEIMNFISIIKKSPAKYLQYFKPALTSKQDTKVYFCLMVINYFGLHEYAEKLSDLTLHHNTDIRALAIQNLAKFGMVEEKEHLKIRFLVETEFIKIEIVKAFQVLGNEKDIPYLLEIIEHSASNSIKFEGLKAIHEVYKLNPSLFVALKDSHPEWVGMINHILDKRIL